MTTINPAFITLAQNYLATKERTPHYEIRSISDCCPADGWCNLQSFSDEEMTQLLALREKTRASRRPLSRAKKGMILPSAKGSRPRLSKKMPKI